MATSDSFTIWKDPARNTAPWRVSIPPKLSETGKRQRRFFATKALAEGEVQRLKVRVENHGIASKLLSPADESTAAAALKLLANAGLKAPLTEIVGEYIARHNLRATSQPLNDAWLLYVASKKRSERHTANLKRTLKRFKALHETRVCDLTPELIDRALSTAAGTYRNAMLREIGAVLAFAVRRGWALENPVAKIERAEHRIGEREVYTASEASAVLLAAFETDPALLPYLAIALFAGIRPDVYHGELVKLEWRHVDLVEGSIDLPAEITKRRRRRSVPVEPVLAAWLKKAIETNGIQSGRIAPVIRTALRDRLRAVFESAGVKRKQDGTRHTYASCWLASNHDENRLALHLGHVGGVEILHRHYHRAITARDASKFWSLTPDVVLKDSKLVPIPARMTA